MQPVIDLLRRELEGKTISKTDLAAKTGLSRVTIDKVLNGGRVHLDVYEAIAKALGKRIEIKIKTM